MGRQILVVDDDRSNRELLGQALEGLGYAVRLSSTGSQGVDAAILAPPDLILMDVDMPEMNGFEACTALKAEPSTRDIPLIFLTGRTGDDDLVQGFDVGGVDYLTKPFGAAELMARVRTHLALRDATVELERRHAALQEAYRALQSSKRREREAFNAVGEMLEGTVFAGRYLLGERLGEGGMGVVLAAQQTDLGREVAVKILRPGDETQREARRQRFEREGRATCAVHHPSAITVLDAGVSDQGLPYLVMERLHGVTLEEVLQDGKTLSLDQAASIVATVADVLAAAHEAGVVHRDIKPGNVFLHRVGEGTVVKVLDFGVAKLLEDTSGRITRGDFVGTPGFMAPETFSGEEGAEVDGRADVYALGVLLFEALSGTPPIVAGSSAPMALLGAHLFTPPKRLAELVPEIPPEVDALVARCLAKDPDERPRADEVASALRNLDV